MTEKNLPFISVIVPFYNIEECVGCCLDSLVAQDYEGEYEILCIDDGSTDDTPAALDAYASSHQGVRVLHKPNGGQSDARNFGVEHAAGEYISFVDGDDVVSPYYLSALVEALSDTGSDLVSGAYAKVNFNEVKDVYWEIPKGSTPMTPHDFLSGVCLQAITDAAWASLAKKSLYLECPFPIGRVYEDTYIIADHVIHTDRLAFVDTPVYGYVARGGSIVHPGSGTLKRCLQYFEALERFGDVAESYFSPESDEQVVYRAIGYSRLWRRLDSVRDFSDEAKSMQRDIEIYVKEHLDQLLGCESVSKGNKIRFKLLAKSPSLYRFSFSIYDRLFRGLS